MLSLDAFSKAQSDKRVWRPGSTRWRSFPSDSLAAIGGGILLLNGRERRGEGRGKGRERGRKGRGEKGRGVDCLFFV